MNALPPLPPVVPVPPEPGEFGRVRRRALMRRLRVPAAVAVSGALVAVALATVPAQTSSSSHILPADQEPSLVETYTPTASPSESATPTATPTPSPTVSTIPTATPAPDEHEAHDDRDTPTPPPWAEPVMCGGYAHTPTGPPVTGTVVDRSGKPLAGITITAMGCLDNSSWHDGGTAGTTDAQGRFSISCFDEHWVVVAPYKWYSGQRSSDAPVGYKWINGVYKRVACGSAHHVVLPNAATVDVQLVDDAGNAVEEAGHAVSLFMAEDGTTPFTYGESDSRGRITFTGLAPGSYSFGVARRYDARFTIAEGARIPYALKMRPASSPSQTPTETPTASPEPSAG